MNRVIARSKVLLVDDDSDLLATTTALLEEYFEVTTTTTGTAALGMLAALEPHVVCADYKLGAMDGITLLHKVRAFAPRTAGVLVTALRESLPAGVTKDEAIFAVVYKPYEVGTLVGAIRDAAKMLEMTRAVAQFSFSSARLKAEGSR
jgi:DNA-binding NtrC family response regulator